jgi:hypothetical protein
MFLKNVVLYEIYSKTLQWPNTFCTSLHYFKIFCWRTDFKYSRFKHKLKLFVYKSTIIVLCFWRSKSSLCLTRERIKLIDYKITHKLECKTTFNSAFVGKKKCGCVERNILQEQFLPWRRFQKDWEFLIACLKYNKG